MPGLIVRSVVAVVVAGGALVGLSACASSVPAVLPSPSATVSNPAFSADPVLPMTVELSALPNAVLNVPVGMSLVVNVGSPADFTGSTVDRKVAVFIPGSAAGGMPAFKAEGVGQSKVKLADLRSGDTVEFMIVVKDRL